MKEREKAREKEKERLREKERESQGEDDNFRHKDGETKQQEYSHISYNSSERVEDEETLIRERLNTTHIMHNV